MANKEDWAGALGAEWARKAEATDRLLRPFGEAAMAALGPVAGLRVLDLGCGGGETTLALAEAGAEAAGVDVSPDLIALAERRRAAATGPAATARFLVADAAEAVFDAPMQALFSRFGAMFFPDPAAAYAHIRGQMEPGAPLAIACWRTPRENEWASVPLMAAKPHLPPAPPADRTAPGPFAWSEPEESFAPLLSGAGWRDVAWSPVDETVLLGEGRGGDPVEAATAYAMEFGPLASRLRAEPEETARRVEAAVREAMATRLSDGHVPAKAAGWVVTARA